VNPPLLIIGASVRAAAESARRGGFTPCGIDLFNDRDLLTIADCRVSRDYPRDLVELSRQFPPMPFLFTGALENSPELIGQISRRHDLLGTSPDVLRRIRDPFLLFSALSSGGFPTLDIRTADAPPTDNSGWLIKPFASGHGMQIRLAGDSHASQREYYQRQHSGLSVGALFLANGSECRMLGCHQQFTGLPSEPTNPFRYCGAIAPAQVTSGIRREIRKIGNVLTEQYELQGLFGCDFVISDGTAYLLEINPRYTSAAELWELLLDRSLVADHVMVCRHQPLNAPLTDPLRDIPRRRIVKLILYAPHPCVVPEGLERFLSGSPHAKLADLPPSGRRLNKGDPLCSLLAWGAGEEPCLQVMERVIAAVFRQCDWPAEAAKRLSQSIQTRIRANNA